MTTDSSAPNSIESEGQPAPENSSNVSGRKGRRTWARFIRDVVLYLVTYTIISGILIGPMFWVWFGAVYADGPKWIAYLFLPLAVLCDKIPILGWLVNEWVNWWIL